MVFRRQWQTTTGARPSFSKHKPIKFFSSLETYALFIKNESSFVISIPMGSIQKEFPWIFADMVRDHRLLPKYGHHYWTLPKKLLPKFPGKTQPRKNIPLNKHYNSCIYIYIKYITLYLFCSGFNVTQNTQETAKFSFLIFQTHKSYSVFHFSHFF